MRLIVDMDLCQDHGQCCQFAPGFFALDDNGRLIDPSREVGPSDVDALEEAADCCPVQAIRIEP